MTSTFPLEVVAAARWVEEPTQKSLTGDAVVTEQADVFAGVQRLRATLTARHHVSRVREGTRRFGAH